MQHPIPAKGGDEYDAFSPAARKALCCFNNRTGLAKYWKRRYNKRVRREGHEDSRTTRGLSSGWL